MNEYDLSDAVTEAVAGQKLTRTYSSPCCYFNCFICLTLYYLAGPARERWALNTF